MPAAAGSATPPARQQRTVSARSHALRGRLPLPVAVRRRRLQQRRSACAGRALDRAAACGDGARHHRTAAAKPRSRRPHAPQTPRQRAERLYGFSVEDLGFDRQPPARTYAVSLAADLQAIDGQTLGYPWIDIVENWHERAFTSFGDGHGVWETGGGRCRSTRAISPTSRQWAQAICARPADADDPRPRRDRSFTTAPPGTGTRRTLGGATDKIQSHGLDLSRALKPGGTGLVWAAMRAGPADRAIASVRRRRRRSTRRSCRSPTSAITVKDSPQNTLVFVTRLDTGAPVAGADVSIVRLDNSVGVDAAAPTPTASRSRRN